MVALPPAAFVRAIDIHSSRGVSRRVTEPQKVAKIVAWFDALPKAPRGVVYACPLMRYEQPTTFEFRGSGGVPLAWARTPGAAACGFSLDYSVRGQARRPVLVGRFLERAGRLLGMRLVPVAGRS